MCTSLCEIIVCCLLILLLLNAFGLLESRGGKRGSSNNPLLSRPDQSESCPTHAWAECGTRWGCGTPGSTPNQAVDEKGDKKLLQQVWEFAEFTKSVGIEEFPEIQDTIVDLFLLSKRFALSPAYLIDYMRAYRKHSRKRSFKDCSLKPEALKSRMAPVDGMSTPSGMHTPASMNPNPSMGPHGGQTPPFLAATPMLPPRAPGAPFFDGRDITDFLDLFGMQVHLAKIPMPEALKWIHLYCSVELRGHIESVTKANGLDWDKVCNRLRESYWKTDTYQSMYNKQYLNVLKGVTRTEKDDLLSYCHEFASVAERLLGQKAGLSHYEAAAGLIEGLPTNMQSRMIERAGLDDAAMEEVNFVSVCAAVEAELLKKHKHARMMNREQFTGIPMQHAQTPKDSSKIPSVEVPKLPPQQAAADAKDAQINELVKGIGALTLAMSTRVNANPPPAYPPAPMETPAHPPRMYSVETAPKDPNVAAFSQNPPYQVLPRPGGYGRGGYGTGYGIGRGGPPSNGPQFPQHCFGCGQEGHYLPRCPVINLLCDQGKIYRMARGEYIAGPAGSNAPRIPVSRDQPHIESIQRFLKELEHARANPIIPTPAQVRNDGSVQVSYINVCDIGDESGSEEEYVDVDAMGSAEVLAATVPTSRAAKQVMEKNKQVLAGRVEKERRMPAAHARRAGEYVDTSATRPDKRVSFAEEVLSRAPSTQDTVTDSPAAEEEMNRENEIPEEEMADAPIATKKTVLRRPRKPRGPKLATELKAKDHTAEVAQKLFRMVLEQTIDRIALKDLLGASPALHRMFFQNLPPELVPVDSESVSMPNVASLTMYDSRAELMSIGQLRFEVESCGSSHGSGH